ncbi:MAG: CotH kinase family protein [Clostridia bacterium]|nr:CotH kinase family protein [Clostridia bacterium]
MNSKTKIRYFRLISIIIALVFCLCVVGCSSTEDNTTENITVNNTTNTTDEVTTLPDNNDSNNGNIGDNDGDNNDEAELPDYYTAIIKTNNYIISSPYTGEISVSDELKGVYYTTDSPGGEPQNDGTGKIWLKLKPIEKYCISSLNIDGDYSTVDDLGNDIYCINGVKSNLSVSVTVKTAYSSNEQIFESYGYGISDNGVMTVTWRESTEAPLRYVELSYTDSNGFQTKYIDASLGRAELFEMTENQIYTVSMRAISRNYIGKSVNVSGCYMKAPKEVSFPRVEITTDNYILPSFDKIASPSNAWGAGITNATYEQCIMTMYNEDNEIVYSSSVGNGVGEEYLGAKLKVRGNTSAAHAKDSRYPYKVKLSEKFDLLAPLIGREDDGRSYADKDWLLLNYGEEFYRICGDAIADAVGTEWSPDYCYVSLYVNGDYRGLYVLSEAVERGNGADDEQWRVAVDNDGYVFECDAYWWNEDLYFDTPLTKNTKMYYTFKYPDSDYIKEGSLEYNYLKNYIIDFENAIKKNDDSYLEYMDLDSFVKWLLVSDYLCISDGGGCNIFLYKEDSTDNTKINMGPNWDFDSYMGDINGLSTIRMSWSTAPFYYHRLIKKSSFQTRYNELFMETHEKLDEYIDDAYFKIDIESHTELLDYQNTRFGTEKKPLSAQKEAFDIWLDGHLDYMETQFN